MSGFEFLFTFYGLLLGLAIANVATGFAEMWRGRGDMTVGWTVPLLGLFILLEAAQQWIFFWGGRELVTMGPWELLTSIAVAFPYIFVSRGMFPRPQEHWDSLESYYLANNRVLIAALLVPPLAGLSYNFAMGVLPAGPMLILYPVRFLIPLVMLAWQRPWVHRAGLILLNLAMLVAIFAFYR